MDNFDIGFAAEGKAGDFLDQYGIKSERTGDSFEYQIRSRDIKYWDRNNKEYYASVKSGYNLKLRLCRIDGEGNLIGQPHNEVNDTLEQLYNLLIYITPNGNVYPLKVEAVKRYIENYKLPAGLTGDFIIYHILKFHKKDLWLGIEKAEYKKSYLFSCYLTRSGEYSKEKDFISWRIAIEKNTDDDYSVFLSIPVVGYKLEENVPLAVDYLKSLASTEETNK